MHPYHALFLCTGNSARSILCEAILNHVGQGQWLAYSAGSHPTGRVNPYALEQLRNHGIATQGLRSKSWEEFSQPESPPLDIVVTVCDSAAQEICPVFLGDFLRTHWGLCDPAAITSSEVNIRAAFAEAHRIVTHRIERLLRLPSVKIAREQLQKQLNQIGESIP